MRELLQKIKPGARLSEQSVTLLTTHTWPGNIRELNNVLYRAVARSGESTIIRVSHFLDLLEAAPDLIPTGQSLPFPPDVVAQSESLQKTGKLIVSQISRNRERAMFRAALLCLATRTCSSQWPPKLRTQWSRLFGPTWSTTDQRRYLRDVMRILHLDPEDEFAAYRVERWAMIDG